MPVVTLKMGSSLNPDDIKEGADVYFECLILSNPKPYKMSWYHNVSFSMDILDAKRAFDECWDCLVHCRMFKIYFLWLKVR